MRAPANLWQNWARTAACTPADRVEVSSEQDVVDVLRDAHASGGRVKPLGAGHSFTPIAGTTGTHLVLDGLRGVIDHGDGLVTVGAGTHLHELPALLGPLGMAMTNLGDIDRQTISGALSTGTHGTGLGFGPLATQVRGLTLVDGTGRTHAVGVVPGREAAPDIPLEAAVIGLGALGVITSVTLQLEPAFVLASVEQREPLGEVLDTWAQRCEGADHHEFFWFPGTDVALTKTNTRLPGDAPTQPLHPVRRLVEDEVLGNGAFELLCRLGAGAPALVPALNRLSAATIGSRTVTDRSPRVFATSRRVRFAESEYAVPFEAVPEVVRELVALLDRAGNRVTFPLEVRCGAADDHWLSTSYGRRTGYIAVHQYARQSPVEYFAAVETVMARHEGRPHWGKMHSLDASQLRELYPRMGEFTALRDRLDPGRVLGNAYLERVLGP